MSFDAVLEEDDEPFDLTAEQEAALDLSIARSERGEGISMVEMLRTLRRGGEKRLLALCYRSSGH